MHDWNAFLKRTRKAADRAGVGTILLVGIVPVDVGPPPSPGDKRPAAAVEVKLAMIPQKGTADPNYDLALCCETFERFARRLRDQNAEAQALPQKERS